MADKPQKTPEEIAKEKAEKRKTQLAILESKVLQSLYIASANNLEGNVPGKSDFGKEGEHATYDFKYKSSLEAQAKNPDANYSKLMAQAVLNAENQSQNRMPSINMARALFENVVPFYTSAIDSVTVKDMLNLSGAKRYDDLSTSQLDMYMGDFKKSNPKLYNTIAGIYLGTMVKIGTGEAIIESGKAERKSLETILSQKSDAKKAEEEAKKAQEAEEKKQAA